MRFKILMAAVAAVLLAYTGFWFYAADRAEARLLTWIEKERVAGNRISYRDLAMSGFPYRLEATFTDFHASGKTDDGAWQVATPKLAGVMLPWKPRHTILFANHIAAAFIPLAGDGEKFNADGLRASVMVNRAGDIERLSTAAQGVTLEGAAIGGPGFAAKTMELHWRSGEEAVTAPPAVAADQEQEVQEKLAWQAALKVKDVVDPRLARAPYGDSLNELSMVLELHGAGLGPEATQSSVAAWRDSGGTVEVPSFTLQWGVLDLVLSGSLTLDQQFRPLGAFTAQVKGYEPVIDKLKADGDISPDEAEAAKETLKSIENGDHGRLPVPVTMQGGRMFLGPLPVANLPPLFPALPPAPPPSEPAS